MKPFLILAYVCLSFQCVLSRDFYMGMFRRNDFLVAQDNLYKERRPYSFVQAEYGRLFKCPITYFRIVDRLGVRGGVTTTVVRGGLLKKYITVRIRSCYNCPISVNIYVGCENKKTTTTPYPAELEGPVSDQLKMTTVAVGADTTVAVGADTTVAAGADITVAGADATTVSDSTPESIATTEATVDEVAED